MRFQIKALPYYVLLSAVLFITYSPIFLSQNIINPDAQFVLYLLDKVNSAESYLRMLFDFRTLDFQPIRDLSFLIDLKILNVFHFNFTVWQNGIWWVVGCVFVYKLLKELFPSVNKKILYMMVMGFMVYPLFGQSIPWGMARKHILAFFFIVCLTRIWVRERESFRLKDAWVMSVVYASAVLSQPISILWPLWAFIHLYLIKPSLLKSSIRVFVPVGVILVLVGLTNHFYYKMSPVFLSNSMNVTNGEFNFADKVLALGHYTFQLFFPYLLAFRYTLGHWATMVGLVMLGGFAFCLRGLRINGKWACSWGLFTFLPIGMALINPQSQYDTYLLIPGLGILILLTSMVEKLKLSVRFMQAGLISLTLIWMSISNIESRSWLSDQGMTKKSFERRPSCLTAGDYLKSSYENEQLGPSEAKKFIYTTDCGSFGYAGKQMVILKTLMLFYENDLSFDERVSTLKKLSLYEFFPHAVLASLYLTEKRYGEAVEVIDEIEQKYKGVRFKKEYSPILAKHLYTYCVEIKKEECVAITSGFSNRNPDFFYK